MQSIERRSLKWIYFTYLGSVGLMATWFPIHFSQLGFTAFQIGLLFAVRTAISIFGQPWITAAADRAGRPLRWLQVSLFGALLIACGFPLATSFMVMAALFWIQTPLQTSTIPLIDARLVTAGGQAVWGSVRLWGSLGYGVAVAGFGLWMTSAASEQLIGERALQIYIVLAAAGAIAALPLKDRPVNLESARPRSPGRLLKIPGLARFFAAHALHWAAVMVFNVFIALHTSARGESAWVPGMAVAVAIAAEMAAFRLAARLIPREAAAGWMPVVFMLSAVRWIVTAWAPDPTVLVAAQILHFFSFGVWFAAAMVILGEKVEATERASMQGLFMAATFGVGGMIGTLAGGAIADGPGGTPGAFVFAAGLELLALTMLAPDFLSRFMAGKKANSARG